MKNCCCFDLETGGRTVGWLGVMVSTWTIMNTLGHLDKLGPEVSIGTIAGCVINILMSGALIVGVKKVNELSHFYQSL